MNRLRFAPLLVLALVVVGPWAGAEEGLPSSPNTDVLRTLDVRGFAVDRNSDTRLLYVYRHPRDKPVYVSSDAGIALYLLLLRRGLEEAAYAGDADLARDGAAWEEAVRARAPGPEGREARFVSAVFAALCGAEVASPAEDVRVAVDVQVARARGRRPSTRKAELLGTPLDDEFLATFSSNAPSDEQARHDGAFFWLTRVRLPATPSGAAARGLLAETLPATLRDRALRHFAWGGVSRLRFPGQEGVFDMEIPGDRRFPPGTLPGHGEAVGLDFGRRLRSPIAEALLARDPFAKQLRPGDGAPSAGSTAAGFEGLLARTLRPADPRAPDFLRSPEWQALSLQSALAADALFRRALGPLQGPTGVFGADDVPGFVHPDPGFWTLLADIARRLAKDIGPTAAPALPPEPRIRASMAALEQCLDAWKPLPEEHVKILARCGLDEWSMRAIESFSTREPTPKERAETVEFFRGYVLGGLEYSLHRRMEFGAAGDLHARAARHRPAAMLERLAGFSDRFAVVAEHQMAGTEVEGLAGVLQEFGFFCEAAEGYERLMGPHAGCVVVLDDPPRRLVHGSAGLHELWVHYPWKGTKVQARGVVFAYREWVGEEWPNNARWRGLLRTTYPPSWAAGALAPVPPEPK